MKRSTITRTAAGMGIAAVLLAGSAGVANAAPGDHGNGGPNAGGRGPIGSLVQNGTLTRDQAQAIKPTLEAAKPEKGSGLDTLVSQGTITQAQADAIKAAGPGGIRGLVANGTLTQAQAQSLKAAHDAAYTAAEAARDAALASLVSQGTITQAQADAINAAIEAKHDANQAAKQAAKKAARPATPAS